MAEKNLKFKEHTLAQMLCIILRMVFHFFFETIYVTGVYIVSEHGHFSDDYFPFITSGSRDPDIQYVDK